MKKLPAVLCPLFLAASLATVASAQSRIVAPTRITKVTASSIGGVRLFDPVSKLVNRYGTPLTLGNQGSTFFVWEDLPNLRVWLRGEVPRQLSGRPSPGLSLISLEAPFATDRGDRSGVTTRAQLRKHWAGLRRMVDANHGNQTWYWKRVGLGRAIGFRFWPSETTVSEVALARPDEFKNCPTSGYCP